MTYKSQDNILHLLEDAKKIKATLEDLAFMNDDKYYDVLDNKMNPVLRELLAKDFTCLTKKDLIWLLKVSSSYRPVEPHQILTKLSISDDNLNGE